ncbi:hypothetical protein D1872_274040 [compost metagenome]
MPKERRLAKCSTIKKIPNSIPYSPIKPASPIRTKRMILAAIDMPVSGITKLDMAVMDTMITIADEIKPAATAACPITSVPTMDIACPIFFGILTPASRKISYVNSMSTASTNAGKGTLSLCAARLITRLVGIIS